MSKKETFTAKNGFQIIWDPQPNVKVDLKYLRPAKIDPEYQRQFMEAWQELRESRGAGRPKKEKPKVSTTIRLDADIVKTFKKTGAGWQTRMNNALREWVATHPA
jgi:uncharacterized protein (DUF4415 family)